MEEFDSIAVTKTCNALYASIYRAIGLLAPSASSRYYVCCDLENGHDYFRTMVDSYKFHFDKLWKWREQVDESLDNLWVSEVINRAINYRSRSPIGHSTFLAEAQKRLLSFEGLYLRLWEN